MCFVFFVLPSGLQNARTLLSRTAAGFRPYCEFDVGLGLRAASDPACFFSLQRNICTEAGMYAIRAQRDFCIDEDFNKAVRKVAEAKKLENSTHTYKQH